MEDSLENYSFDMMIKLVTIVTPSRARSFKPAMRKLPGKATNALYEFLKGGRKYFNTVSSFNKIVQPILFYA